MYVIRDALKDRQSMIRLLQQEHALVNALVITFFYSCASSYL